MAPPAEFDWYLDLFGPEDHPDSVILRCEFPGGGREQFQFDPRRLTLTPLHGPYSHACETHFDTIVQDITTAGAYLTGSRGVHIAHLASALAEFYHRQIQ